MSYQNEFKLVSCKYIFRRDDATDEELIPYKLFLERDGATINNLCELFTPFIGEEKTYLNEDIGTDELRIIKWLWTTNEKEYELLDINAWLDDIESGIICIKDNTTGEFHPLCDNNDNDLSLNYNTLYDEIFRVRLEFFGYIRESLSFNEDDVYSDMEGIEESISIQHDAWKVYKESYDSIIEEHERLKDLYLQEFKVTRRVQVCSDELLAEIGYTIKPNKLSPGGSLPYSNAIAYLGWTFDDTTNKVATKSLPSRVSLVYLDWTFDNITHKLLYVNDQNWYQNKIYMLNNNGKIGTKVFTNFYLSKDRGNRTPLILALHKRVYSIHELVFGQRASRLITEDLTPLPSFPLCNEMIPSLRLLTENSLPLPSFPLCNEMIPSLRLLT